MNRSLKSIIVGCSLAFTSVGYGAEAGVLSIAEVQTARWQKSFVIDCSRESLCKSDPDHVDYCVDDIEGGVYYKTSYPDVPNVCVLLHRVQENICPNLPTPAPLVRGYCSYSKGLRRL